MCFDLVLMNTHLSWKEDFSQNPIFKHNFNITAQTLTFGIWLFLDPVVCELPQQRQS